MSKASGKTTKDVYEATGTFTGVWLPPEKCIIVGLDVPVDFAPELADPDRLNSHTDELVVSIAAHGVKKPIKVGRFTGKLKGETVTLTCVVDGRRRVTATRAANERLRANGADVFVEVPCVPEKGGDPLVTLVVANEHHLVDGPMAKARKAQRLRSYGKSEKDIQEMFGVNGATIANWEALLSLVPEVLKGIEQGVIPLSVAYQLGRMPKEEQMGAVAQLVAAAPAGELKGELVVENARNLRKGREITATVSTKLTARQMKALHTEFAPIDDPKKGDVWDGDGCEMVYRIFDVIIGNDPTAKGLRDWPDVHKAVKKALKSKEV